MVPRAVPMKSGLVSINTAKQNISKIAVLINNARQVNAAHSKTTMNVARPMSYLSKIAHSTVKRPIHKNTAFKNSNINQRVNTVRGILRHFSVARTPQQNGVAERRNRTLIEADKTMLANSKLLTTFWAEAVSSHCYVQNRVLVVKPHNKTPYELFHGKFDDKAHKGFFVGYSLNSKAFRVFNSRTRIVEGNLHIRFSKSTPNVVGTKASDNNVDEDPRKESECKDQEKKDKVNNTNNVNIVSSTINAAGTNDVNAVVEI
ncbi:putative ribonuclease H-like domain-containing protein [Tanacetum coccineum]